MSDTKNQPEQAEAVVQTDAAKVQPEEAVEAPAATATATEAAKVEVEKPTEVAKEAAVEAPNDAKPDEQTDKAAEPTAEAGKKDEPETEAKGEAAAVAAEEAVVSEKKAAEIVDANEGEAVTEATNGKHLKEAEEKVTEPAVDETNGVCKRKAENGADVVDDEKSPKKAKVVDEGDQKPVEETAA